MEIRGIHAVLSLPSCHTVVIQVIILCLSRILVHHTAFLVRDFVHEVLIHLQTRS